MWGVVSAAAPAVLRSAARRQPAIRGVRHCLEHRARSGLARVPESAYALYLVTDDAYLEGDFYGKVQAALEGGVTCVQLRLKNASTATYVEWADKIRYLTYKAGVPLIVDDRLDVALAVDADGLHVGGEDLPWRTARRLLGPGKVLGCSTYGRADLVREALHPDVRADYLGSGSVFSSPTKEKCVAKGLEHLPGLRRLVAEEAGGRTVPLVAIGGVGLDTAAQCIEQGADGVATVSALLQPAGTEGVRRAAQEMSATIHKALEKRSSAL